MTFVITRCSIAWVLLALAVAGQSEEPETQNNPGPDSVSALPETGESLAPSKPARTLSLSERIEQDPDVRVAQAEVQLAQEKLAQVRAETAQRILGVQLELQTAKGRLANLEDLRKHLLVQLTRADTLEKAGNITSYEAGTLRTRASEVDQQVLEARLALKMQESQFHADSIRWAPVERTTRVYPVGEIDIEPKRLLAILRPESSNAADSFKIEWFEPNRTLVVTATSAVHGQIGAQLRLLESLQADKTQDADKN